MGDVNEPKPGEIAAALAEATRIRQETLSFMQAAEKADTLFIRGRRAKFEGYTETPYGAALVGARDAVDRLTLVVSSLTRLERGSATIAAAEFGLMRDEIARARAVLAGLGAPPACGAVEDDDDDD